MRAVELYGRMISTGQRAIEFVIESTAKPGVPRVGNCFLMATSDAKSARPRTASFLRNRMRIELFLQSVSGGFCVYEVSASPTDIVRAPPRRRDDGFGRRRSRLIL